MNFYTKETKKTVRILSLIIISIVLTFIIYKGNFYFFLDDNIYQMFHVAVETLINITAGSIFLLLHYLYPYENKAKYIISGSLFLSMVVVNTMHIYFSFIGHTVFRIYSSNLVHFIVAVIVFLFAVLPKKPLNNNRIIISVLPVVLVLLKFLLYFIDRSHYIDFFVSSRTGATSYYFEITLCLLYLFSLITIIREYKKNNNVIYSSLIHGMVFFIYSWIFVFMVKNPTDVYSILSQIFKLIGMMFLFRAYYMNSIKRPFENLKDAKRIAEEASSIKTDFIVNLSHELRTPVNVILNALRMLEVSDNNSNYIGSIEKNARRLNKVCENIIIFNEIENGLIDISPSETDVVYMIDGILEEADAIADDKNLDIIFNFDNKDIVLIDKAKLKTILLNLISNAIKYVPTNGTVDISLNLGDNLELMVLNNGPLIHEQEKLRLFDKFYKSADNRLCSREGLGIGLYISRMYTEAMGGTIDITNNNGFTGYKLTLPIKKLPDYPIIKVEYDVTGYFTDIS